MHVNCYSHQLSLGNTQVNTKPENKKNSPSKELSHEMVMLTAISSSGIGRVLGLDIGKDLASEWAKKKAACLTSDKEQQKILTEKLLKKIKLPVTFSSTVFGVLFGLLIVLIPAKLYNNKVRRNNL